MTFQENTVFYLDDICIPRSWETVMSNINDKLYFKLYVTNAGTETEYHRIATIEARTYNPVELATEFQTKLNAIAQPITNIADTFTCSYQASKMKIQISIKTDPRTFAFKILTPLELKTTDWNGTAFDRNKPNDINDIISNLDNTSNKYRDLAPFMSGTLYLQPFNNIYIHSSNLGNYNTIGCQNERTIAKKVPVTADFGKHIYDQCVLMNDYNDCSGQTVKTLFFQLKSSKGDIIPLNGCNWSFSIIFSRNNPDL
jgi:hypothetical protein